MSTKQLIVNRLIHLGRLAQLPGFDLQCEKKFMEMTDELLLTFFELVVIQSHKDGVQ